MADQIDINFFQGSKDARPASTLLVPKSRIETNNSLDAVPYRSVRTLRLRITSRLSSYSSFGEIFASPSRYHGRRTFRSYVCRGGTCFSRLQNILEKQGAPEVGLESTTLVPQYS
jgi:hypothetical protein